MALTGSYGSLKNNNNNNSMWRTIISGKQKRLTQFWGNLQSRKNIFVIEIDIFVIVVVFGFIIIAAAWLIWFEIEVWRKCARITYKQIKMNKKPVERTTFETLPITNEMFIVLDGHTLILQFFPVSLERATLGYCIQPLLPKKMSMKKHEMSNVSFPSMEALSEQKQKKANQWMKALSHSAYLCSIVTCFSSLCIHIIQCCIRGKKLNNE